MKSAERKQGVGDTDVPSVIVPFDKSKKHAAAAMSFANKPCACISMGPYRMPTLSTLSEACILGNNRWFFIPTRSNLSDIFASEIRNSKVSMLSCLQYCSLLEQRFVDLARRCIQSCMIFELLTQNLIVASDSRISLQVGLSDSL